MRNVVYRGFFRHEDDNYHLEYIPVYEIFPLVPKSENDAKMLLLAHHWNFCEP